jgi:hypothetical protein
VGRRGLDVTAIDHHRGLVERRYGGGHEGRLADSARSVHEDHGRSFVGGDQALEPVPLGFATDDAARLGRGEPIAHRPDRRGIGTHRVERTNAVEWSIWPMSDAPTTSYGQVLLVIHTSRTPEDIVHIRIVTFHLDGIDQVAYQQRALTIAPAFRDWRGLRSKLWLADPPSNTYGGVYVFDSTEDADASRSSELFTAMVAEPAFTDLDLVEFSVLAEPSAITAGALA